MLGFRYDLDDEAIEMACWETLTVKTFPIFDAHFMHVCRVKLHDQYWPLGAA